MTTLQEALPCPFCGKQHTLQVISGQELMGEDQEFWQHSESFGVVCDASTPDGKGGCGAMGGFKPTEDEAIEAWNTRTAQAQQREHPVCHGCGIPAGDVHMKTCKSGKWPSRVSNGDTAAPAPQAQHSQYGSEDLQALILAKLTAPQAQEPAKCNHCGGTGELEQFTSAGAPTTKMVCLFCKGDKSFPVFKDKNPELAWIEQCKRDEEPAQGVPETNFGNMPVKFLVNGTRFKMSFFQNEDEEGNYTDGTHVMCFDGYEKVLDGRWVALVAAEDDCHLQSTQPKQEPLTDGS